MLESSFAFRHPSGCASGGECRRIGRYSTLLCQNWRNTAIFGTAICHADNAVGNIAEIRNFFGQQCVAGARGAHVACTTCAPRASVGHCAHMGCVRLRPSKRLLHILCLTRHYRSTECVRAVRKQQILHTQCSYSTLYTYIHFIHTVYCSSTSQCTRAHKEVCPGSVRVHAYTAMHIQCCGRAVYVCARKLSVHIIYARLTLPCAGAIKSSACECINYPARVP